MSDDIYLDDNGRFQMAEDELGDFAAFLRENKVGCRVEPAASQFRSEGRVFAFATLQHPFDADAARELYRTWRGLREARSPA